MTRTKLAKLLNTTPTRIGKILTGDVDLSLSSMAQIAFALGSKIKIQLEPIESENHAT
jgi:transcriptional regulator with XRE-family HTH domain